MKGVTLKALIRAVKFSYFLVCFWLIFSVDAQAYIDPSAVTYMVQAVAAVFIALGAALTVFRHKIFAFFKRNAQKSNKREIHVKEEQEDKTEK